MRLGQRQASTPTLASSLTHTELPIELVGKQGVGQLPEVELAEGGYTVDVLQEGWAGQFWDPLTVKLMPKTASEREGRPRSAWPPLLTLPSSAHRWMWPFPQAL
jgi:hypothetical protein